MFNRNENDQEIIKEELTYKSLDHIARALGEHPDVIKRVGKLIGIVPVKENGLVMYDFPTFMSMYDAYFSKAQRVANEKAEQRKQQAKKAGAIAAENATKKQAKVDAEAHVTDENEINEIGYDSTQV